MMTVPGRGMVRVPDEDGIGVEDFVLGEDNDGWKDCLVPNENEVWVLLGILSKQTICL